MVRNKAPRGDHRRLRLAVVAAVGVGVAFASPSGRARYDGVRRHRGRHPDLHHFRHCDEDEHLHGILRRGRHGEQRPGLRRQHGDSRRRPGHGEEGAAAARGGVAGRDARRAGQGAALSGPAPVQRWYRTSSNGPGRRPARPRDRDRHRRRARRPPGSPSTRPCCSRSPSG